MNSWLFGLDIEAVVTRRQKEFTVLSGAANCPLSGFGSVVRGQTQARGLPLNTQFVFMRLIDTEKNLSRTF